LKCLAKQKAMPGGKILATGYGFGKRETGRLNGLQATLIETDETPRDRLVELSANIDDMTGEELAFAAENLLAMGALDVWTAPIMMKKGRSANLLNLLVRAGEEERFIEAIFRETTTLGVRICTVSRIAAPRETLCAKTAFGEIRVKRSETRLHAEYEDAAAAARANGISLREAAREAEETIRRDYRQR